VAGADAAAAAAAAAAPVDEAVNSQRRSLPETMVVLVVVAVSVGASTSLFLPTTARLKPKGFTPSLAGELLECHHCRVESCNALVVAWRLLSPNHVMRVSVVGV
jgi:hypothetical protein